MQGVKIHKERIGMNQRTTALAAILAVAVIALAGVGYATFSGTTTMTGNSTSADWIVVVGEDADTNGAVLNGEDIVYNVSVTDQGAYKYDVAALGGSDYANSTNATAAAAQTFATKNLTIKGNQVDGIKYKVYAYLGADLTTANFSENVKSDSIENFKLYVKDTSSAWQQLKSGQANKVEVYASSSGLSSGVESVDENIIFGAAGYVMYLDSTNKTPGNVELKGVSIVFEVVSEKDPAKSGQNGIQATSS